MRYTFVIGQIHLYTDTCFLSFRLYEVFILRKCFIYLSTHHVGCTLVSWKRPRKKRKVPNNTKEIQLLLIENCSYLSRIKNPSPSFCVN